MAFATPLSLVEIFSRRFGADARDYFLRCRGAGDNHALKEEVCIPVMPDRSVASCHWPILRPSPGKGIGDDWFR